MGKEKRAVVAAQRKVGIGAGGTGQRPRCKGAEGNGLSDKGTRLVLEVDHEKSAGTKGFLKRVAPEKKGGEGRGGPEGRCGGLLPKNTKKSKENV